MRRRWRFVGPLAVATTLLLMIAPLLVGDLVPEDRPANSSPACALTVVYIGLGVLALGVTALFIGARRRPVRRGRSQHAQAEAVPVLVPPADVATAICERPLPGTGPQAVTPSQKVPPTAIQTGLTPLPAVLPTEAAQPSFLPNSSYSRRAKLICGSCSRVVPGELGMPPWCPFCGADFKAKQPAGPADPLRDVAPRGVPLQPPYFEARIQGLGYRVYVLPDCMLFLECPLHEDGSTARHFELDLIDPQALLAIADEEADSFRIDFADIKAVGIDALGFWQRTITDRCAARLHFWYPVRGQVDADLPRTEDVRVALTHLTAALGDRLESDATWDHETQKFVPNGQGGG